MIITGISLFLAACDKAEDIPVYGKGTAPQLSASSTTIAPAPSDSNSVALTLNWSDPKHATDSSNVKYTIEIDSSGKNFTSAVSKVVMGSRTVSFTAKELNAILLGYGYPLNVPVDLAVMVISSY